jgi:hypothetical protein
LSLDGEKKILGLLATKGKMSKSRIRMITKLKRETLDNSIMYLLKMHFIVVLGEGEQSSYQITRDGIYYLQTIAKDKKLSKRVE